MSFEKTFPSLKGEKKTYTEWVNHSIKTTEEIKRTNDYAKKKWIELSAVTKNCVDKARLLQKLEELKQKYTNDKYISIPENLWDELEEFLGGKE